MKVALLGAAGTGKSWLARALAWHEPGHVFLDAPELDAATDWDQVLLMGLDWPTATDAPASPDSAQDATAQSSRRTEDVRLRTWLSHAGRSYGVVYGQGPQRLRAAMQLLFPQDVPLHQSQGRWRGTCEHCADPDCEFRLFTGLAAPRLDATAPSNSKADGLPPG